MRRVVLEEFGGPDKLKVQTAEDLQPAAGEVLVDVEAAGLNYIDIYQREGASRIPPPIVLGLEGVGRVLALGDDVASTPPRLAIGARVAWIDVLGSYASQVPIPASRLVVVPETFSIGQALLFQALTAQYLAQEYRDVQPGDRVLVHAAAGGLGQLLVHWFKHLEAWVVGTTSTETKASVVRSLGADEVILLATGHVKEDARHLSVVQPFVVA